MPNISIRSATPDDLPTLLRFEQGIIAAERPFDHTLCAGHIHYYDLAELIARPDAEVVVAEAGGQVIGSGYALIEKEKPYRNYEEYAYLGFMYVEPEYRGQGVNRMIIEALTAWAAARNVTVLQLEVYPGNETAIRAYEKVGFSPYILRMRRGV